MNPVRNYKRNMNKESKNFISNGVKKTLIISVLVLLLGLAPHALAAQNFVPIAEIPGLTSNVEATSAGLAGFLNNLYKYLIGLAAILAVIEIIWGGLEISTKDSVSKQSDGRNRIKQAIFGLVLVLSPALIFSIINPSILNLSLNLPELDTKSAATTKTGTGGAPGATSTPIMNKGLKILSVAFYGQKNAVGDINDKTKKVVPNGASLLNTFTSECAAQSKTITAPQFQAKAACLKSYGITDTSNGIVCAMYNVFCQ